MGRCSFIALLWLLLFSTVLDPPLVMSQKGVLHMDRAELIHRILDLESENSVLSRQLRMGAASKRGSLSSPHTSHNDPTAMSAPSPMRTGPVSPAAARMSVSQLSSHSIEPLPRTYEISMSVMVIENGSALSVPLSSVLDKTYGRLDVRDADTPVVSSKFLRDPDSLQTQRFSIGSVYQYEPSPSMNLNEEFAESMSPNRGSSGSGSMPFGSRGSVLIQAGHVAGEESAMEEEPMPKDPRGQSGAGGTASISTVDSDGVAVASSLAKRAGVTNLNLRRDLLFARDLSLDEDAIITHQTLKLFNQQFGRDTNILSPVSSYGNAVYHYVVKTFAVRNGCEHSPDDVEGFGRTMIHLCREVKNILEEEPRHGSLVSPCYVFGDLHGNFRDLFYFMDNLISFQDLRYTPHRFLFLGDYVDRGDFSVEVVAYLFAMKVLAPSKVLLLRGNHEDTLVSGDISGYGSTSFRAQCHSTFGVSLGEELWNRASETFARLPLTANIDQKIYCTHGGIPRYSGGADDRLEILKSNDFPVMTSFFEVPKDESPQHRMYRQVGMDTCWADPAENEANLDKWGFGSNPRGTGVILFGTKAVEDFLDHYRFEYIFRAHQEKSDGLKLSKSARVFTIFSTSAYVGHQNGAGVVLVADGKIRLIVKNADTFEEEEEEEPRDCVDAGDRTGRGSYRR